MSKKKLKLYLEIALISPSILLLMIWSLFFFINNTLRIPYYYRKKSYGNRIKGMFKYWYEDTIKSIKDVLDN